MSNRRKKILTDNSATEESERKMTPQLDQSQVRDLSKALVETLLQGTDAGQRQTIQTLYSAKVEERQAILSHVHDVEVEGKTVNLSILHAAIWSCPADVTKSLIYMVEGERKLDLLQQTNSSLWTPLHFAAQYNTEECAKYILEAAGIQERAKLLRMQEDNKWTPLHVAARYNSEPFIKSMLSSVSIQERSKLLKIQDSVHWTPLHIAAQHNTGESIRCILESVSPSERFKLLTIQNINKWTPLHEAADDNAPNSMICILNSVNSDDRAKLLRMQDSDQWTPLHRAARNNTADCVRCLLDSVNKEERAKLLHMQDNFQWTPIHRAARNNTADCMKFILYSVDPETQFELLQIKNSYDYTPLHLSVVNAEHEETLRFLLSHIYLKMSTHKAKELLAVTTDDGNTLLHLATRDSLMEQLKIIVNSLDKYMFSKMAATANNDGKTPEEMAESPDIKQLIEDAYAPVNSAFPIETPPTVLIFYSTIEREESEEEMNSLCQLFTKNRIYPKVYKDASSEQLEMEIKWATEGEEVSSLVVAVLSHGTKGNVNLRDKTVEISSIVSIMSASPLAHKPKVLLIQACQTEELYRSSSQTTSTAKKTDVSVLNNKDLVSNILGDETDAGEQTPLQKLLMARAADAATGKEGGHHDSKLTPLQRLKSAAHLPSNSRKREFTLTASNFLVLMATVSGGIAYRNVLIPYLVEHMERLGLEDDVYDSFLKASWRIQEEYSDQTPIFMSTMTKKFCLGKFLQH